MVAVTKTLHNSGSELSDDEELVVAVTNVNQRNLNKQKISPCKNFGLLHSQNCPAEGDVLLAIKWAILRSYVGTGNGSNLVTFN